MIGTSNDRHISGAVHGGWREDMTATSPRVARVAIARGPRPGTDRIEVRTQDGLTGFGEGYWGERGLRRAPEMLLGRSPFEAEAIYDELAAADPDTPGGLDMALWDLMGKALGTASAALLGKTFRARVVACAAVGRRRPSGSYWMWRSEPETAEAVEGGFECGVRLTAASVDEALAMGAHLKPGLWLFGNPRWPRTTWTVIAASDTLWQSRSPRAATVDWIG